ncbi:nucleotide sugar dehydrogenase [Paenibacillus radicis (ex Gao et al. 2016)]|uniref:UDP-N-acetyl-D-glucosamine dehydrogenase n=1 Tax=Paenibacillus radicis (ex Gao et al. 2016) TaxID=1737354 RepID=A0A917HUQ7_9BACL|nr:nucleotide sugar dehydrogenase [Paenibacillus radicis (ex Gao et al. 2016)]GGG90998.1 UDP-N-acetyl-D-glucosamine dehydrogenase [Paenibacillus radicis (ex Gao et al. 2016)]
MMIETAANGAGAAKGKVGIIGLGFVGLPLAIAFIKKGFNVVGIDLDPLKINAINEGRSYVQDIENEELDAAMASSRWFVSTEYTAVMGVDTIILCVPTPLSANHGPDLSYLTDACTRLYPLLRHGQLIIVESSTYPGTTREVVKPLLEKGGLQTGQNLFIAYSPERIDPGNRDNTLTGIPKVVSGVTPQCLARIEKLYSQLFDHVIPVSTTEAAETTKLLENSFRFINISFMNEFADICEKLNVNIWEVIEAAASKPYGYSPFYPGPGIGGHCIPIDPLYLQWKAEQFGITSKFIQLSQQINDAMPASIVTKLQLALPKGKALADARIIVYGVTYKRNIADSRESAAIAILNVLQQSGADISYHDPYVPSVRLANGTQLDSIVLTEDELEQADCLLIGTDHTVMPAQFIADHSKLILDTRHVFKKDIGKARIIRLGDGTSAY